MESMAHLVIHRRSACLISLYIPVRSIIEFGLLVSKVSHSLASVHAKSAFFATYYDPYNPDLYLHVSRPDTLHCSIPTSPWSISYVTSASQNTGWIGVTKEILNNITCILRKLQHQTWEVWGADYQGQPSLSWPPT